MGRIDLSRIVWYAILAGAGYGIYRWLSGGVKLSPEVADKLPIAKHLDTVSDAAGNYDIDGVSFDEEGVIVSGDAQKTFVAPV